MSPLLLLFHLCKMYFGEVVNKLQNSIFPPGKENSKSILLSVESVTFRNEDVFFFGSV